MGHNKIGAGQSSYAADQHRSKPAQEKWFQVNQPYLYTGSFVSNRSITNVLTC